VSPSTEPAPELAPEPVPARTRLLAFAVDYAVIAAYLCLLLGGGLALSLGPWGPAWRDALAAPWRMQLLAFATTVLPVTLYFALSESGVHAASLGKRRLGVQVVTAGGGPPSLLRSLLRNVCKFLPWQLAHTAMLSIPGFPAQVELIAAWPLGLLTAAWILVALYLVGLSAKLDGRPIYDRIAGTTVRRGYCARQS